MKEKVKNFILISVFLIAVILLAIILIVTISYEKRKNEYENYNYSLSYYEICIDETIDGSGIDIDNYIDIDDYSRTTAEFNHSKETFSSYNNIGPEEYRYYIDNKMIFAENCDSKGHCFFIKNKTGEFDFCYKIVSDYRYSELYIRNDYVIPSILTDHVKSIMIVPKSNLVIKFSRQIQRVNTENNLSISDEGVIDKCIMAYKNQNKNMSFLKSEFDISFNGDYIVLAVFDNDAIYQFLGNL